MAFSGAKPIVPFNAARGLLQGNLMSPFLFDMAMGCLRRSLNELKYVQDFKYHPRCVELGITHLSFAYDLVIFTRGDLASIAALQ